MPRVWHQGENMSSYELIDLITLANRAKNIGYNEVANVVFAILTGTFFKGLGYGEPSRLGVSVETQDKRGDMGDNEAFYDLVVIKVKGANGVSLCIPTPLLDQCTLATYYKYAASRGRFVERQPHDRTRTESSPELRKAITEELMKLLAVEGVREMVDAHLSEEVSFSVKEIVAEELVASIA